MEGLSQLEQEMYEKGFLDGQNSHEHNRVQCEECSDMYNRGMVEEWSRSEEGW